MKKLTITEAEILTCSFRANYGLSRSGPINVKSLIKRLNINTLFRPLSDNISGISCQSKNGKKIILVNSNKTKGRQNFTIASELYHLFYDEVSASHICFDTYNSDDDNANVFASCLLIPKEDILHMIKTYHRIELEAIVQMEQLFQADRIDFLLYLKQLGIISESTLQIITEIPEIESAREFGYDSSLYEPCNSGLFIGDHRHKDQILYESKRIANGHYIGLLNLIAGDFEQ